VSSAVELRIRREIEANGPISFARYMELALYAPGGFYDEPPVGAEAHFVTSPHVHDVFSELIAAALRDTWNELGRPSPFRVVEVGAGDGTLARGLLHALSGVPVAYEAVERSAGARRALRDIPGISVHEELADVEAVRDGVVLANELLDNLPFRRVRGREDGPVEVCVGLDGDRLTEVERPCELEDLAGWSVPLPGGESLVAADVLRFVDELSRALERGVAVLIDYATAEAESPWVHGYRAHRLVDDVLTNPGASDITAGVDFRAVMERARARGFEVVMLEPQRDVLMSLGLDRWMREALDRQGELVRHRAGIEAVRAMSGRSRATLLVDPAGLGTLQWLVLSAGGTSASAWRPPTSRPAQARDGSN
jgi:NADH dehydrogenase [ubiquinone] 1 alpha subcomplex assembly factor 7